MERKLIIDGKLRSLNDYVNDCRANRQGGGRVKKEMDKYVTAFVQAQLQGVWFNGRVQVDFLWVCDSRRKDPDNICFAKKFILDALVKCGIIPNDTWRYINGFTDSFELDQNNPRIEVTIREV